MAFELEQFEFVVLNLLKFEFEELLEHFLVLTEGLVGLAEGLEFFF
jgi:hypothetical protein